jgi:glycerol-3-phosphate dehydrogenase
MSDTRLVIETIMAARQEGAICLNYARVDSTAQQPTGEVRVGWTDVRTENKHELTAGIVINCAGPWAPSAGRLQALPNRVRYSRGSHLVFSVPWKNPALFLPLEGKNRFYFILPHLAGTLVGTTESEYTAALPLDPNPTREEVDEILTRLKRDMPDHGLNRTTLTYGFAGIRTLPIRGTGKETSAVSRRHHWELQGGMLTLYGGKYTSAYWTAFEGLRQIERLTGSFTLKQAGDRLLPGAFRSQEVLSETLSQCLSDEQRDAVRATHQLFGSQLRYMTDLQGGIESLQGNIVKGAIEYACRYEQVETLEDLMRRRLEVDFFPDPGEKVLAEVAAIYAKVKGETDLESELRLYRKRLSELHTELGIQLANTL